MNHNHNFQNLVFEGGGVKGIAYGGALDVLHEMNILPNIKRVAGTSAGAINATMLAMGYTCAEVSDVIAATKFSSFEDHSRFILSNLLRMIKKFGWNKGEAFHQWIGQQIKAKTGNADFTFRDLEKAVENDKDNCFRLLYVVATNLSKQKSVIFSHEHTPDTAIRDAVRMSMSIPLFFQAFLMSQDIMVDGGVSFNYPINLFDYQRYISHPANGEEVDYSSEDGYQFNHETLGFRLDSTQVIDYAKRDWSIPPEEITSIKSYAGGLVNFMMEMANKVHLHRNDWNRTIFIDTLDVKTTDFELPESKIQALIESGKKGVRKYFGWRNTDEVWSKKPIHHAATTAAVNN